ncbi:hypothetical protein ASG94_15900 [Nocardioides sp. Soil805]|nr:hypothetical protein ASG94_15900 [Nocardioides sp. Soil805]
MQWTHHRDETLPGVAFTNSGTTTALDVHITIDRTGHDRITATAHEVLPLEHLTVPGLPMYNAVLFATADTAVTTETPLPGVARLKWRSPVAAPTP